MAGRIVYADVPFEASRFERAARPLCWLGNALVAGVTGPAALTSRVRWLPTPEVPALSRTNGPVVYVTWHRYNLAITPALKRLPAASRPSLVMHDGLASRALTHEASAWFGFETFVFHRRSPVSPRRQIADYVRSTGRHLAVLPDAGGPYGRVKPGLLQVAADCGAWNPAAGPEGARRGARREDAEARHPAARLQHRAAMGRAAAAGCHAGAVSERARRARAVGAHRGCASGLTTSPHGSPPTATRRSTLPVAGSTIDMSWDVPLAV